MQTYRSVLKYKSTYCYIPWPANLASCTHLTEFPWVRAHFSPTSTAHETYGWTHVHGFISGLQCTVYHTLHTSSNWNLCMMKWTNVTICMMPELQHSPFSRLVLFAAGILFILDHSTFGGKRTYIHYQNRSSLQPQRKSSYQSLWCTWSWTGSGPLMQW